MTVGEPGFSIEMVSAVPNRDQGTMTVLVRLRNTSRDTVRAPVKLRALSFRSDVGDPSAANADAYADAALRTMTPGPFRDRLLEGCRRARRVFTLDAMVERFAGGVHAALEAR